MTEIADQMPSPRRRRPRRPVLYLTLLTLGAAVALGSAWQAAHRSASGPAGVVR